MPGGTVDPDNAMRRAPLTILEFELHRAAAWTRVMVRGQVDVDNSFHLEQVLLHVEAADPAGVAVDLAEVGFLSAAGIRALSGSRERLRGNDRRFALLNPQPYVEQALRVGGLADAVRAIADHR